MQNTPLSQINQVVTALNRLAEIGDRTGNDLYSLHIDWDTTRRQWQISALTGMTEDEPAAIDAVRVWADAIDDGTVHLGETEPAEVGTTVYLTRRLDCRGTLAGVPVELHERLYDLGPLGTVPDAA